MLFYCSYSLSASSVCALLYRDMLTEYTSCILYFLYLPFLTKNVILYLLLDTHFLCAHHRFDISIQSYFYSNTP